MAKHTQFRDAITAIDKTLTLKYARPETSHRAVGSVLSLIGARRLNAAASGETDGVLDRRILQILAQVESLSVELDAIPITERNAKARQALWGQILGGLSQVRYHIVVENRTVEIAAAATA